jgi:hypothetical protein
MSGAAAPAGVEVNAASGTVPVHELHRAAEELASAAARAERCSRELMAKSEGLVAALSRAADRFAREARHETIAALVLVAAVAAGAAVLATLLTLAVLTPKIGLLGVIRALLRRG